MLKCLDLDVGTFGLGLEDPGLGLGLGLEARGLGLGLKILALTTLLLPSSVTQTAGGPNF